MAETSPGKDTTGHWEMGGIILEQPFHVFPPDYPSFPEALIRDFTRETGFKVLGNKAASGTVIIEELGQSHLEGDGIIVYTSADSVFQIAAHEKVVPLETLYETCETARKLCDPLHVGRVIARPFVGKPGSFKRAGARKDYGMEPPAPTILDHLSAHDIQTVGIGKIGDIFMQRGLTKSYHDAGNDACLERTLSCLNDHDQTDALIFVNLVDTDMLYGHRRDVRGYHDAVLRIDQYLPDIMDRLDDDDLLIITADHGCDPAFKGSDHTREYVPLLCWGRKMPVENLKIRSTFCDVAQSLASFFSVPPIENGTSFIEAPGSLF